MNEKERREWREWREDMSRMEREWREDMSRMDRELDLVIAPMCSCTFPDGPPCESCVKGWDWWRLKAYLEMRGFAVYDHETEEDLREAALLDRECW